MHNTRHNPSRHSPETDFDRLVSQFRQGTPLVNPNLRESFELTFHYHIRNQRPALRIGETNLINKGEICSLIGAPGAGKSNLVEDIVAGFVCQLTRTVYSNSLVGFAYDALTPGSRMLVIDFERPHDDVARSVSRIFSRLGANLALLDNYRFYQVSIRSQIELESLEEKRHDIRRLLSEAIAEGRPYDYLLLDGCLDLTPDMNDSKGSAEAVRWIRSLTAEFNLATITTLHPNKNSETAAGHFGSYLHRYSRAFLLLKLVPHTDGMRMLTSGFDLGKLSHSSTAVECYFQWDASRMFFMPADVPQPVQPKSRSHTDPSLKKLIGQVFEKRMSTQITAMEFKKLVLSLSGESESKVKRMIAEAVEFGYVQVTGERKTATYHLLTPD